MSKRKSPEALQKPLFGLLRSLGIEGKVLENMAVGNWSAIVGEQIAAVTEALRVENSILFVRVTSSSWRNELIFMKKEILHKIDKEVGRGIIKDIKYV